MKDTKRALRRHHRERMIQRALRSDVLSYEPDRRLRRTYALRWFNNLAKCSCHMCGNPRRIWATPRDRLTTQELRQLQAARHELETELWPRSVRRPGRHSGGA